MSQSKFQSYEKVTIRSLSSSTSSIDGQLGAIFGHAPGDDGTRKYAVFIYSEEEVWSISENELETTGQLASREDFYDGSTIRVRVDEEGVGFVDYDERSN